MYPHTVRASELAGGARAHLVMLKEVLESHPAVKAAQGQLEAATSEVKGARWQYYPTPSVGAEKADNKSPLSINTQTTYARLQQPLWTGGRLQAQLDRAQAQEDVARSGVQEQRLALAIRWIELWTDVQSAQLRRQAFEEGVSGHQLYVQQVRNRAKEGQAPASDVQLSVTRLTALQADLAQIKSQEQQAMNRLVQMYGKAWNVDATAWTAVLPKTESELEVWTAIPVDRWLEKMWQVHPSLTKTEATRKIFQADIELAKSRSFPEIYLRGDVTRGDVTGTSRQVFVGLSSSFGPGLSTQTAISAAQSRLDASVNDEQALRRNLSDQIQSDIEAFQMQVSRWRLLQQSALNSARYLYSSERQFKAGKKNWQELMNTAREQAQTLAQLAEARTQSWLYLQKLQIQSLGVDVFLESTEGSFSSLLFSEKSINQ